MGTRGSAELRRQEAERAAEIIGCSARENARAARRRNREHAGDARDARAGDPPLPPARRDRAAARGTASRTTASPPSSSATPASSPASPSSRPTCRSTGRTRSCTRSRIGRTSSARPSSSTSATSSSRRWPRCAATSSQFDGEIQAGEVYPERRAAVRHRHALRGDYGSLIRTRYGEPFFTTEMMRVDDVVVARGSDILSDASAARRRVTYGSYLALDELLALQRPRSGPSTRTSCCSSSCIRRASCGSRRSSTSSTG